MAHRCFLFLLIIFTFSCSHPREGIFDPFIYEVWEDEVSIIGDFLVGFTDTLVIREGTKVIMNSPDPILIIIYGSIQARGSFSRPVQFINTGTGLCRIILTETSRSNVMEYCDLDETMVEIWSNALISHCRIPMIRILGQGKAKITNCTVGMIRTDSQAAPAITYNQLDRAGFSGPSLTKDPFRNLEINALSTPVISHNNILGDSSIILPATNYTVMDFTSENLNLVDNYWGIANVLYVTNSLLFNNTTGVLTYQPWPFLIANTGWVP